MSQARIVCVDLDGTLLTDSWPTLGDWMPGAAQAMLAFHEAGCHVLIHTSRLNPFDRWSGKPKPTWIVATEKQYIRAKLDRAGLTFVDVWTKPGKPGADVYIDNKGERYNGKMKSWEKMVERVLMRFNKEDELVPDPELETLEEHEAACRCICDPFGGGMCNHCMDECMFGKG